MSQENVELVREALATFKEVDKGLADLQRLTEFFAPDGPWEFVGGPEGGEFRGLEAFLEFRATWAASYDEWNYAVEEILDAGASGVVATFNQRGRPHGSDSWVDLHYAIVYTISRGLIQRAQIYAHTDEALEAVGLRE